MGQDRHLGGEELMDLFGEFQRARRAKAPVEGMLLLELRVDTGGEKPVAITFGGDVADRALILALYDKVVAFGEEAREAARRQSLMAETGENVEATDVVPLN